MIKFEILATTTLLSLGACGGSVPPVTFATPGDIAMQYGAATGTNVPPAAYATTYYSRNLRACANYFNGLVTKQNDAGKFAMLGSTAGAILGAAGGPAGALGGLAAGTALGTGLLNAEASPGGELPVAGYTLWQHANGAYLAAAPTPPDQPTAQLLGDANAALCTPIGIQANAMAAMMSAPVVAIPSTGPVVVPGPIVLPTPTPVPAPIPTPPIVVPPPIVVAPTPDDPNGPIVTPTARGAATLTPPGTPLPHHRSRARIAQPSQEELQFRAIQQYGRNAIEGGQRVLPPMICVGAGCVR